MTEAQLLLIDQLQERYPQSEVIAEYQFCKERKFRFDCAVVLYRIAFEIDGGVWTHGRHVRGNGYIADMAKQNLALVEGWRVFHFSPQQVLKGEALAWIKEHL